MVLSFETVCKFDIVIQISCHQKLGIGCGCWSPEKISPKKISQKVTEKNRNQFSITGFISSITIANN